MKKIFLVLFLILFFFRNAPTNYDNYLNYFINPLSANNKISNTENETLIIENHNLSRKNNNSPIDSNNLFDFIVDI